MTAQGRPTVLLVHGGLLGPWCFDALVAELAGRGLAARAPELPIEDPALGAAEYADVVAGAAADLEEIVLVGHSMSGTFVPMLPGRLPVAHMMLLATVLPIPGTSMAEQFAADPAMASEAQHAFGFDEQGRFRLAPADAERVYFHDCPPEVARRAAARLRPQSSRVATEPSPLRAWPDVPTSYVIGTEDRAMPPEWVRRAVPERLKVDPIEIPGGHAPFLARPALLAELIAGVAAEAG